MGGEKGRRGDPGETGRGDREGLVSQRREFEFYSERLGKRRRVEGTDTSDQPTNQPTNWQGMYQRVQCGQKQADWSSKEVVPSGEAVARRAFTKTGEERRGWVQGLLIRWMWEW